MNPSSIWIVESNNLKNKGINKHDSTEIVQEKENNLMKVYLRIITFTAYCLTGSTCK